MLVRVITYTFTDPCIPGAGEQVYRLVTTLLDPFLYPAKEVAVVYHERWHIEGVIVVTALIDEISHQRVPKQQVRIQARVVKRARSRYERKKPEHYHAPPLELDLDFHHIIALLDQDSHRPVLLI